MNVSCMWVGNGSDLGLWSNHRVAGRNLQRSVVHVRGQSSASRRTDPLALSIPLLMQRYQSWSKHIFTLFWCVTESGLIEAEIQRKLRLRILRMMAEPNLSPASEKCVSRWGERGCKCGEGFARIVVVDYDGARVASRICKLAMRSRVLQIMSIAYMMVK